MTSTENIHSIDDLLTVAVERNVSDLHQTARSPRLSVSTGASSGSPIKEKLTPEADLNDADRIL